MHHHLAVLEHVRDARRNPQIILENQKITGVVANNVDAGDMCVDAARHIDALHFRPVLRIAKHLFGRNHPRLQYLLLVVDIVNKRIQRAHALLQARVEPKPFCGRQYPWHDVERNQTLAAFLLAVNGKRDTNAMEEGIRLCALLLEPIGRLIAQPLGVTQVVRSRRKIAGIHLIKWCAAQLSPYPKQPANSVPRRLRPRIMNLPDFSLGGVLT